ncbi:hypothetical protein KUTeg_017301 [Tegillarca granosa]|uniref:Integrase catalytic domain-containing protein n=1 Tax=Tegillarca granosa TaxID=220873 RepID=A0ABQ9EMJ5_TEGGR|nr:hypothetical protein KUTeg_017301 [Tegillarca granosa]
MDEKLKKIWNDHKNPAGYAGAKALYNATKGKYSLSKIKRWLRNQQAYSVRKQIHTGTKSKITSAGFNYMWDLDLADVSNIKQYNDGIQFLLICIDTFSRYAFVEPIKNKQASSILKALTKVIRQRKPSLIRTDRGSEFVNQGFKKFCKDNEIVHIESLSDHKAAYAEAFIRTLKHVLYTYFQSKKTYKFINVLQDLVKGYNHRKHSRLHGFSPAEINEDTQYLLWRKIYAQKPKKEYKFEIGDIAYLRKQPVKILARFRRNTYKNMYQLLSLSNKTELKGSFDEKELRKSLRKRSPYKFKIGDLVRITHKQRSFKRGYHQKWTEEVFKISNRYLRNGKPIYKIEDLDDEPIEGFFYNSNYKR